MTVARSRGPKPLHEHEFSVRLLRKVARAGCTCGGLPPEEARTCPACLALSAALGAVYARKARTAQRKRRAQASGLSTVGGICDRLDGAVSSLDVVVLDPDDQGHEYTIQDLQFVEARGCWVAWLQYER